MAEVAMIERVAKAMAEREGDSVMDHWRDRARTAIEAMRVPTEAMLEAGGTTNYYYERSDVAITWPRMIDAALSASETASPPNPLLTP